MTGVTDRHDIDVLDPDTCWGLLASEPVGRIGFVEAGTPRILPINHLVDGASVVFRTPLGSKLDVAERSRAVAFEVDRYEASQGTGWSVLATGVADVVDDPDEEARLEDLGLRSWALGVREELRWVRIRIDEISGRWAGRDDEG